MKTRSTTALSIADIASGHAPKKELGKKELAWASDALKRINEYLKLFRDDAVLYELFPEVMVVLDCRRMEIEQWAQSWRTNPHQTPGWIEAMEGLGVGYTQSIEAAARKARASVAYWIKIKDKYPSHYTDYAMIACEHLALERFLVFIASRASEQAEEAARIAKRKKRLKPR